MLNYRNKRENIMKKEMDLEQFKDYVLKKLDKSFLDTIDTIMEELTKSYRSIVRLYKDIYSHRQNDPTVAINIENPTNNIEDCIVEDSEGKILINNQTYSIDKDAFRIIHFLVQRIIVSTLRNTVTKEYDNIFTDSDTYKRENDIKEVISDIRPFYWENIRNNNRRNERYKKIEENVIANNVINYPSKNDYIYSCIHSSIVIKYADFISEFKRYEEGKQKI